jgi:flagellar P-ring protein precursor FlgI
MDYVLRLPDYTTATRVAEAVNEKFGEGLAAAMDAGTVRIAIPPMPNTRLVEYFSSIEALTVEPDKAARVIIDEKTGTVVMGKEVRVSPVALSHGSLTVKVTTTTDVSQPLPFSKGTTVVSKSSDIQAEEKEAKIYMLETGESLSSLVDALNALGVSPREMVTIFQALKAAGALEAELVIM